MGICRNFHIFKLQFRQRSGKLFHFFFIELATLIYSVLFRDTYITTCPGKYILIFEKLLRPVIGHICITDICAFDFLCLFIPELHRQHVGFDFFRQRFRILIKGHSRRVNSVDNCAGGEFRLVCKGNETIDRNDRGYNAAADFQNLLALFFLLAISLPSILRFRVRRNILCSCLGFHRFRSRCQFCRLTFLRLSTCGFCRFRVCRLSICRSF